MAKHVCPWCFSEYQSPLAAVICEEDCAEADLHARQQLRGRAR